MIYIQAENHCIRNHVNNESTPHIKEQKGIGNQSLKFKKIPVCLSSERKRCREDIDIQIPEVLVGKDVGCKSLERKNSNETVNLFLSSGANIASWKKKIFFSKLAPLPQVWCTSKTPKMPTL